jgi:hypothetical protein
MLVQLCFRAAVLFSIFSIRFSLSIIFIHFPFQQTYKDFQVKRISDCKPNNETYLVHLNNVKVEFRNPAFRFRGSIEIAKDLPEDLIVEVTFERCDLFGDYCMRFDKWNQKNLCTFLETSSTMVYRIAHKFRPIIKCPIKQGIYQFTNETMIPHKNLLILPLQGNLWKITAILLNKKFKPLSCVHIEMSVVQRRERKSS